MRALTSGKAQCGKARRVQAKSSQRRIHSRHQLLGINTHIAISATKEFLDEAGKQYRAANKRCDRR